MSRSARLALLLALCASPSGLAQSALLDFAATLHGEAVVPPTASTAAGQGRLQVDPALNLLRIELGTQGLSSVLAAQLRSGAPGSNGPVLVALLPGAAGSFAASLPMSPSLRAALDAGLTYLSVSTAAFPGGEIRGSVSPLAFGIEQRPLGNAQLRSGPNGESIVAGIGSSGNDGVECRVNGIGVDADLAALDPQSLAPVGAAFELRSVGSVQGGAPSEFGSLVLVKLGPGDFELRSEFQGLGSSQLYIEVYDEGVLVQHAYASAGSIGRAKQWPLDIHSRTEEECDPFHHNKCFLGLSWRGVKTRVALGGGPEVDADLVLVHPVAPAVGYRLEALRVLAGDLPEFTLRRASTRRAGVDLVARGAAALHDARGRIHVSRSSGAAPAELALNVGRATSARARFAALDASEPVGAFLEFAFRGTANGVADQALGSTRAERTATGYALSADFSALGSPSCSWTILNDGVEVFRSSGANGAQLFLAHEPQDGCWLFPPETHCYYWPFPEGELFTIGGQQVAGDLLLFLPENPALSVGACSSIVASTTASDLELRDLCTGEMRGSQLTPNNRGSIGGALFFDLEVHDPRGLAIQGLDLTLFSLPGTIGEIELWTADGGSYAGLEQNPSAWRRRASASVVAAAQNSLTPVSFDGAIVLPPGTHGIALHAVGLSHAYVNGNGANEVYSCAEFTLRAGAAQNAFLSGAPFRPRVFCGIIWMEDMWEFHSFAATTNLGGGCGPSLTASRPVIGSTLQIHCDQLPSYSGLDLGLLAFGPRWPSPLDLTPFGAPGCWLHLDPGLAALGFAAPSTGSVSYALPIPSSPWLEGASISAQVLAVAPYGQALGLRSSNGIELHLGLR
ncbi:MAG: CHRD domain-containing protein [Planctomycetes bacterium]|nr:CHRD domain-containing protein [Planctomycetota bacterium]